MSTRSQIGFYESKPKDLNNFNALIYRHSDGYPEGVLPNIIPFLKWWKSGRGLTDTEYVSARLLQWLCNEYDRHGAEFDKEAGRTVTTNEYTGTLGHGICKNFHGDIEYFYAIYPYSVDVYDTPFDAAPENWKLLISIDLDKDVDMKQILKELGIAD